MSLAEDLSRSVNQLSDPRFLRVVVKALVLTIAILVALFTGFVWILPDSIPIPWVGEVEVVSALLSWAAIGLMIVLSMFLMFPVASIFIGFLVEDVADAVEDRHYPGLPDVTPVPLADTLIDAAKFFGVMVAANLVGLVIYLFTAFLAPFVFWAINGFLLGREYFQMVAQRRLGRQGADDLRKRHFGAIWMAGALMAVPLSVPVVNLFVPVIGVAVFTHLFHRLNDL